MTKSTAKTIIASTVQAVGSVLTVMGVKVVNIAVISATYKTVLERNTLNEHGRNNMRPSAAKSILPHYNRSRKSALGTASVIGHNVIYKTIKQRKGQ